MDQPGYLAILRSYLRAAALALAPVALAAWLPLSAQQPDSTRPRVASGFRVKVAPPDSNQARGVDAELRIALFDLAADRPLAALSRLEWLRTSGAASVLDSSRGGPSAAPSSDDARSPRSRADLLFLLAESYNRLGMDSSFRTSAGALAATPGSARYAAIVGSQLMLDAYRRGDYAKVLDLARSVNAAGGSAARAPLASLLSGLAAYQEGDFTAARAAFAAVRAEGGVYAPYAQLMDALALMRGDTTRAAEALGALRSLAQVATGSFGDHVRLVAAELAYETEQYPSAVASARGVGPGTGLAAQALLTQGWALYRAGDLDAARAAFASFAARYPLLPERDEARLMAGQVMLEAGDAQGAERYFQAMADSVAMESAALRSQSTSALSDGARSLVAARAAGIAFVNFPRDGKTLALRDGAGGEAPTVLAAFAGSPVPATRGGPSIVSVADVEGRMLNANPALDSSFPRRLLYTPAGKTAADSYAALAQQLSDADVRVALAGYKVSEQVEANDMKIAALEELRLLVGLNEKELAANAGVVSATRDSLASMRSALARGRDLVGRAILARVAETRRMAAENRAMIDSVRGSFAGNESAVDRETLDTEEQTAGMFDDVSVLLQGGLDALVARHPVFALADSLGGRVQAADSLNGEVHAVLAADSAAASEALSALRARESERTTAARTALAAAERQRAAAERELVTLVDTDLRARAQALTGELQRDRESAEYGSANAAFFHSMEPAGDTARRVAIDKLSAFVTRYPESSLRANALYQLGELLVRRADDVFATAQRAGGGDAPDRPDYSAAIARYEDLTSNYPDFAHLDAAAYTLGTLYAGDQRFERAAAMFERVTAMTGSAYRPESFFRLGDARFEIASRQRGAERKASFVGAARAYESATAAAETPGVGDIYFLSLYKLGWSYYNQATRPDQPEYRKAVDVFGRLVTEYDSLTPEQQSRLGLRGEAIEYMAVALTQVGGAEAANQYFATHSGSGFKLAVLRRLAASLRDQGDFGKAVDAYRAVLAEAPTDSSALAVQREIVDIYQNRVLEPERAQQARLALVNDFAPGSPWAVANPTLVDSANRMRESALRESAQYELARAQRGKDRARFGVASELYGRYMGEFGGSDSAQTASMLYGESLFGNAEYASAGTAYSTAAYQQAGDRELAARAGQNAIVAFDSAVVRSRGDVSLLDSLFTAVDRYVATFPEGGAAKTALIEKGKRASDAGRWDVVATTFRTYAERFPDDAYTPTAQKLIGDAMYKQGQYSDAQAQWERAQSSATGTGKRALADSINTLRNAAAVSFGDSLVKSGNYDRAAKEVYVAFADRNPSSSRAPDALRNAIETYVIADSAARVKGDSVASRQAKEQALALSKRLVQQYPDYEYRAQYQSLQARLLAEMGQREDAVKALDSLIADNPKWDGRADAMVRRAVMLDSLGRWHDAAAAYETFSVAYPKDARAADAQYNAAVTYLEVPDSASAARAYGDLASRFPRDERVGRSQQLRVALLEASGDSATAESELARLCRRPSSALAAQCAARTGEREFRAGKALFQRYQPLELVIPLRVNLTRKGIARISAPKRELLTSMSAHFTRAIGTGSPEWLAASSYYMGLAQWEYGDYLKNVTLPADLTGPQLSAAQTGSAQQAEQYYAAARKTWSTLVDKATKDSIASPWVDRARAAIAGTIDRSPVEGAPVVMPPADSTRVGVPSDSSGRMVKPDSTRERVPSGTSASVRSPAMAGEVR